MGANPDRFFRRNPEVDVRCRGRLGLRVLSRAASEARPPRGIAKIFTNVLVKLSEYSFL